MASKVSACRAGYFSDPLLMARLASSAHRRKDPMINRGTWLRVRLTEEFVRAFIERYDGRCAVVVPGAGLDTLFWRLPRRPAAWVEGDLHEVCEQKARKLGMRRAGDLARDVSRYVLVAGEAEGTEGGEGAGKVASAVPTLPESERRAYTLIGCDIEQVAAYLDAVVSVLRETVEVAAEREENLVESVGGPNSAAGASSAEAAGSPSSSTPPTLPTLFVSEVFASYMEADATVDLIRGISERFASCAFFGFEMVNPHDDFGQMMVYNMSLREVFMPTFAEIGFVPQYKRNFELHGWEQVHCVTALEAYRSALPEERARIERLEWLDEFEQFNLIMGHYAFLMAGKGVPVAEMYAALCGGAADVPEAQGATADLAALRAQLPDAS